MTIPLLRHGSFGSHVRDLQTTLNAALSPSPNLINDGVFGGQTYAAVRRFQTDRVRRIAYGRTSDSLYGRTPDSL